MSLTDATAVESSASVDVVKPQGTSRFSFVSRVLGIAVLMLAVVAGYGRWCTGSLELVWPWLTGQSLVFKPMKIELGTVEAKKWIETEVYVINLSNAPKALLGSQKSCGCIGVGEFPIEIPANSTHILKIRYSTLNKPGSFEHFVKYFSDDSECRVTQISMRGKVE